MRNGSIKLSKADGSDQFFINFFNGGSSGSGIIISKGGTFDNAAGSTTLMRIFGNEIYFDAEKIGIDGSPGKTGRAEFSDGTYLEFKNGFLMGGNTSEGAF